MVHFPYSSLLISYCIKQMGCTSDGLASNFLCTGCNVSLCTDYQLKSQTHIWFIHAFHQLRSWDPCKSWKLNWCQLDFTKSSQDSMIISDKRLFFCHFIYVLPYFSSKLLWHLHVCIVITKTPSCLQVITITPISFTKTLFVASLILIPRSVSYPVSYAQPISQILIDPPWPFFTSLYNQCIWWTLSTWWSSYMYHLPFLLSLFL